MFKLVRNQVGFEPLFDPDKSSGGLYIPETAKTRSKQGIVKALGPDVKDIKIGDYCLFSGYDGTMVAFENDEGLNELILIIPEDAVDCSVVIDFDLDLSNLAWELDNKVKFTELMAMVARQFQANTLPLQPRLRGESKK